MDADERLTALKKAYADIILNTAKEAAARIMASERKTLRFQHELYVSKEEALQMLLRLKQMMNSTISEAAVRSLSQQKKIDELEAQLQEAEDIVKDLRQELREVQAELERVKSYNEQDVDERYNIASQHESVTVSETNIFNSNEGLKCFSQLINTGQHSYVTNPDLPSIIVRTKEPELYRNGCTQRIRACERNILDRELSPSNDVKHETSVKEAGDDERICAVPTHESGNMFNIEKKGVTNEGSGLSSWYKVRPVKSIRRKRKRAFRFGKKRAPRSAKHTTKCEEEPSQMDSTLSLDATKTRSRLDYTETAEGDVEIVDALDVQSVKQNGSRETSGVPACKTELEKVGVALVNSESKASDTTNGIPCQPVNDRVIKYTFQRKRKRAAMSSSEGSAPAEKSNLTRNTGDKQNGCLEPQKLVPLVESSRDSRRLAQVARQLISLSEKKWWQ